MAEAYVHTVITLRTVDEINSDPVSDGKPNESLSIILDSDSNEGKTSFPANSDAFFLVLYSNTYTTDKSNGVLTRVGSNISYAVTQSITFAYSNTGTLTYVPMSVTSWYWVGDSCGTPSFNRRQITLASKQTGLLRVEYTVRSDRWKLVSPEAGDVVVSAHQGNGDLTASLTIPMTDAASMVGPFILNTKDFCTDAVIAGSSVYVDTVFKGTTNAEGKVSLGMLSQGEHSVQITAPGYLSTSSDHLNNDKFTVTV